MSLKQVFVTVVYHVLRRAVKPLAAQGCATSEWRVSNFLFLWPFSERIITFRKEPND